MRQLNATSQLGQILLCFYHIYNFLLRFIHLHYNNTLWATPIQDDSVGEERVTQDMERNKRMGMTRNMEETLKFEGRKSITLLESSHALPACPSDSSNMQMKTLELLLNNTYELTSYFYRQPTASPIIKKSLQMLNRKVFAVCSDSHSKHINTITYGQGAQ